MTSSQQTINYRIAELADVEAVFEFEMRQRFSQEADEFETMMAVWNSAFRKEALEHYFKLGWSFIAYNEKKEICGFFMGQPLLFFDKQTQTLWIEHASAIDLSILGDLIEIAYKLAREKHFQRVVLPKEIQNLNLNKSLPFQNWERENSFFKTTK